MSKDKKIWISRQNWRTIINYAESAYHQFKAEIGGQMVVLEDKDGDFILEDPVILEQSVSSGDCTMTSEALALHYAKMADKHGNGVRHCWWHSHNVMRAFWSGTDDSTIMDNPTKDFSISLVVNLKQEYKLRVQFFYPIEHDVDVEIHFLDDMNRDETIDAQVKALCSQAVRTITTYNNNGYQQSMFNKQDKKEVDDYNYGYTQYTNNEDEVDMSQVPKDKLDKINDMVEAIQDKLVEGNCTYPEYEKMRIEVNKSIKKYNLSMRKMDKCELQTMAYHYWPADFLQNINKEKISAN